MQIRIVRIIRGADDSSKSSEEKDSASGAEEKADSGELKAVKAPAASAEDKADSGEQNVDKDRAAAVDTAANLQESSGETVVTEVAARLFLATYNAFSLQLLWLRKDQGPTKHSSQVPKDYFL